MITGARRHGMVGLLAACSVALGMTATATAAATPVQGTRINAGGGSFTGTDGAPWVADGSAWSEGGSKFSISRAVEGAAEAQVYRTERRGARSVTVPGLPAATYRVVLHFAETEYSASGKRVFDVTAEGSTILSGLDVFARVGGYRALTTSFDVPVTDGVLDLGFLGRVDRSTVSGIEVVPVGATPSDTTSTTSSTPAPTASTSTPAATTATTAAPAPTATGTTTSPASPASGSWPTATATVPVTATVVVKGALDGGLKRYVASGAMGDGAQSESQKPVFELAAGASLSNVIIGAPGADGIHCLGACTLTNVWWEDVGEDAATFLGSSTTQVATVIGGGARSASDKVFQHNGAGTVVIRGFRVESFGKLYRSCGNCRTMYPRHVVVQDVTAQAPGKTLVGINTNYGDTADLSGITVLGDPTRKISICDRYTGNSTGAEPVKTGSGADGTSCRYDPSAVHYG
jgi:pectate lyase